MRYNDKRRELQQSLALPPHLHSQSLPPDFYVVREEFSLLNVTQGEKDYLVFTRTLQFRNLDQRLSSFLSSHLFSYITEGCL